MLEGQVKERFVGHFLRHNVAYLADAARLDGYQRFLLESPCIPMKQQWAGNSNPALSARQRGRYRPLSPK